MRFLFGWPIFRGELLVSGRVPGWKVDINMDPKRWFSKGIHPKMPETLRFKNFYNKNGPNKLTFKSYT